MSKLVKNVYTKSRLIKELAFRSGIKQSASKQLLEVLAEIAYRETKMGPFIIPGICKLELCDRKARKMRNPRTGAQLIMPPHKALRITASRLCRNAVAPRVSAVPAESYVPPTAVEAAPTPELITPAPVAPVEETPVVAAVPAPSVEPETAPIPAPEAEVAVSPEAEAPAEETAAVAEEVAETAETAEAEAVETAESETAESPEADEAAEESVEAEATEPVEGEAEAPAEEEAVAEEGEPVDAVSFRCPGCQQEIEAPSDCIGQEAECPMCGRIVIVPAKSEPGTMYGEAQPGAPAKEVVTAKAAENMEPSWLKNCTIRIDASVLNGLGDEPAKPAEEEKMISFFCKKCHQEIEASYDMIGSTAECPNCGAPIEVPMASEEAPVADDSEGSKKLADAQKNRTMRIDLGDDF